MSKEKRIIHIPRRFVIDEWGGSETFIAETSVRLQKNLYHVQIFTTKALDSHAHATYKTIPIRRFSYFYPYIGLTKQAKHMLDKKAGNLFSFSLLNALLREKSVALFHLHTGKRLGGIVRFCAKRRKIPYVISLHGGKLAVPQEEQKTWVEPTKNTIEWGRLLGMMVGSRKVLDDANAIICVGKDEYEAIRKEYPQAYVEYLPNGVDIHRFAHGNRSSFRKRFSIAEDRFVLLTVARIDVQKNQLGLIRQLPYIREKIPHVHYVCIGHVTSEKYKKELEREITALGLEDAITIIPGLSYTDETLVDAYHSADCFVLPSLHEPFGMVVLEAWASSLAVVVSQRGGLTSLVTEKKSGLFFNPEASFESPESMASVITHVWSDKVLRKQIQEEGYKEAKDNYSWDRITERLEEIYRRVHENFVS